jgi:hypothetical protein
MPLDPNRVRAVFLSAVECHEPAARTALLDRECATDIELRRRVETLLKALDHPESLLDQPIMGPAGQGIVPLSGPADIGPEGPRPELPVNASEGSGSTIGTPSRDPPSKRGWIDMAAERFERAWKERQGTRIVVYFTDVLWPRDTR